MAKIFFITGASGVGKISLVNGLKDKYKNKDGLIFLHFDSIGVPSVKEMIKDFGSVENWQKQITYQWIEKMLNEYEKNDKIIFEGQVNLQFIIDGFRKHNFTGYKIILIDCREDIMIKRLTIDRNQPEIINDDMKNWLKFLRKQANDFNTDIIDASDMTKEEVVNTLESMISAE